MSYEPKFKVGDILTSKSDHILKCEVLKIIEHEVYDKLYEMRMLNNDHSIFNNVCSYIDSVSELDKTMMLKRLIDEL
jgi:hypothetical protein